LLATIAVRATPAGAQTPGDPQPPDAIQATLAAFDHFSVVALGMSHWQQAEADFSLALVHYPSFASAVNDIVIECGNPRYQDVLDHYTAGDSVPLNALQPAWRNTTQPGRCDPRQHKELLDAVREVNRHLPPSRRLRVLAGDSPIDWDRIHRPEDLRVFLSRRDIDFASVVEHEVLAKHRKALLVIGAAHVLRRPVSWRNTPTPPAPTVTMLLQRDFPGSTYVIAPHDGFGDRLAEFEARFAAWPRPALMPLKGTWLGSVPAGVLFSGNIRRVGADPRLVEDPYPDLRLEDLADAFLFLGPLSSLTRVEFPDPTPGPPYERELARRHRLMGEPSATRARVAP
jgi:hypothetical protein